MSPPPRTSSTHDALERALDALERIEADSRNQGLAHVRLEHRLDVVEDNALKASKGLDSVSERVAAEERLARQEIAALRLEISKANGEFSQQLADIKTSLKIAATVAASVLAGLVALAVKALSN